MNVSENQFSLTRAVSIFSPLEKGNSCQFNLSTGGSGPISARGIVPHGCPPQLVLEGGLVNV
jgi:hypothetical protein